MSAPASFSAAHGPCAVCGANGPACSRCRLDYYCGKEHQRGDWNRHRRGCGVLEVRVDDVVGRHVVALKKIPAGTLILRETPLVVLPNKMAAPGQAYCAGCCKTLWDDWKGCRRCGWPLCTKACGEADSHQLECKAFQKANFKLSRGEVKRHAKHLWRALDMLKVFNAGTVEPRVQDLQSDFVDPAPSDEVKEGSLLARVQVVVALLRAEWRSSARWLRDTAGLSWLGEEELCRAGGRCHFNSMAVAGDAGMELDKVIAATSGDENLDQGGCRGIFSVISLLEHSCVPSAFHMEGGLALMMGSAGSPTERLVMAARDLCPGDRVSVDYLNGALRCAAERLHRLCAWGFVCRCPLCSDPTDRGLHLGSVCCQACAARGEKRFVLCPDPVMEPWVWRCEACGQRPLGSDSSKGLAFNPALQEEQQLKSTEASAASLERFVERNLWPRGQLHPTHYLVQDAKMSIIMQLVRQSWTMLCRVAASDMPGRAEMKRAEQHCEALLTAMDASGLGLCERRINLLQPLLVVKKILLRLDMTAITPGATAASGLLQPRINEIVGMVNQMYAMMLPREKELFKRAQKTDLDRLLQSTGYQASALGQPQNVGIDLGALPGMSNV